jgi:L-asparaginase
VGKSESKKHEKLSEEHREDIADEVLDDGYIDVMEDKTVVIYTVGGTIAMKTGENGGLVPAATPEELLEAVPGIRDLCNIEVVDFSNVPSGHVTPQMMLDLSRKIQKTLLRPEVSGVVVTHGTDTLEETAYFLAISQSEKIQKEIFKPIVVTGAMRGADALSADGPANLLASVRVACHDVKEDLPRVVVCLNDEIHAASRVTKVHSGNCQAFGSPGWGPVGYVDEDCVYFRSGALQLDSGLNFPTPAKLTAKVPVIKAVTGDDGEYLEYAIESGADGIVIEGFGRGNIPPKLMKPLEKAAKRGIPVVIASRTHAGRVLDCYGYKGSVQDALSKGAVMAGETTSAKARLLLMYILSQPSARELQQEDPERFRAYLQETLDPVLSDRLFVG